MNWDQQTRLLGTWGCVATTHWLASATAMAAMERGGNAFDAAVAAGFVLQIVEPHNVGPGGDVPILFHCSRSRQTRTLCGQGVAPADATIAHYRSEGLTFVPGNGLLATVVPGAFDAWMLLLRDYGALSLREALEPAIFYARNGHPALASFAHSAAELTDWFGRHWPASAALFSPGGRPPVEGELFRNPALADCYQKIIEVAEAASSDRQRQIEAARDAFYRGFVAEEIDAFCRTAEVMDETGVPHRAVLSGEDLARWSARYEATAAIAYHGVEVHKTRAWGQGPTFLVALNILRDAGLSDMDPVGEEFVHTVVEAVKLALADREVYFGDPDFINVPLDTLLDDDHGRRRLQQIASTASFELRPSDLPGFEAQASTTLSALEVLSSFVGSDVVVEPALAEMRRQNKRDTVHIAVTDRFGNMVAAMPSGGWFQSSPVIPSLGFMLNTRCQMFWLHEGLASSLVPGKRPRTTLTPTLVTRDGLPIMAFGSPGGDQQEQWQLPMFLRHIHHGMALGEAIEAPSFFTNHAPSSFYPRKRTPGHLLIEGSYGEAVARALLRRGHSLEIAAAATIGRLVGVSRRQDGVVEAAATQRLRQASAIAR